MFSLPPFLCALLHLLSRYGVQKAGKKKWPTISLALRFFSPFFFILMLAGWIFCSRAFFLALFMDNKALFFFPIAATALFVLLKSRRRNHLLYRMIIVYTLISPLVMTLWFCAFYNASTDDCNRLEEDPRVRALFSNCTEDDHERLASIMGNTQGVDFRKSTANPRAVFLSSDPRFAYLVNGEENPPSAEQYDQAFLLVNRETGNLLWGSLGSTILRGSCVPEGNCYLTYPDIKKFGLFDEKRRRIVKMIDMTPPYIPRWPIVDQERQRLYIGTDGRASVHVFDLHTLALESIVGLPGGRWVGGLGYLLKNPVTSAFYLVHETAFYKISGIYRLSTELTIDEEFHTPLHLVVWGMGYLSYPDVDPDLGELYIASVFDGSVYVFEEMSGEFKERIPLGVGIFHVACDRKNHRLFAAGYVDGTIHTLDLRNRRVVDRIFIGKKIRFLSYDSATDHLLAASTNGWFEIDVSGVK